MDLNTLHNIDEELTKSEVAALKFLCSGVILRKRLEKVNDAKDLFLRLREQALLNDHNFLAELLYTIRRFDLLEFLGTNKKEVSGWLQTKIDPNLGISPYRKMLYKLSEDITAENLRAIKFLLDELPKAKLQDATFLDVLTEMEKSQLLTKDNLDGLVEVLDKCDKQLASQVREFQNLLRTKEQDYISLHASQPEEAVPLETIGNCSSSIEETSEAPGGPSVEAVIADAQEATVETPTEGEEFYSLIRRPRGYCLIFNNYDFGNSCSPLTGRRLSNRAGTHKDAEELERVFKMLHFLPEEKNDLTASEMLSTVKEFAEKDHSEMDAFVCCILSHGMKGTVLGADGVPVKIRDLTLALARCKTLLKKPKVFFIQACQGNQFQKSVQADGDEDEQHEEELEDDAQSVYLPSIPIEADFLIGMATVESYQSFRHTTKGSIFIQELCCQMKNSLHRKEDILSILTRVNREVSRKVLKGHKQMPEPRYTLTKKLVFTVD